MASQSPKWAIIIKHKGVNFNEGDIYKVEILEAKDDASVLTYLARQNDETKIHVFILFPFFLFFLLFEPAGGGGGGGTRINIIIA